MVLYFFQVEFIVMGGTFLSLPDDYRDYFIRNLHDALSGHTSSNVSEVFILFLMSVVGSLFIKKNFIWNFYDAQISHSFFNLSATAII